MECHDQQQKVQLIMTDTLDKDDETQDPELFILLLEEQYIEADAKAREALKERNRLWTKLEYHRGLLQFAKESGFKLVPMTDEEKEEFDAQQAKMLSERPRLGTDRDWETG